MQRAIEHDSFLPCPAATVRLPHGAVHRAGAWAASAPCQDGARNDSLVAFAGSGLGGMQ